MLLPTNFPFCILASLWLGKCSDQRKHSAPGFLSLLHLLANSSPLTWCCWWWWCLRRKERIVRQAVSAEGGTANSALSGNGIENWPQDPRSCHSRTNPSQNDQRQGVAASNLASSPFFSYEQDSELTWMPVIIIVTILLAWAVVISLPASPSPACRESLECWRSRDYISVLF